MLLLRERIEMFSNMFWIRGEGSVYINIRGEGSVIQVSLRGVYLLNEIHVSFTTLYESHF